MNYLAHALLSGNDQNLLIGNFIADHLHGNNFEGIPLQIVEGIKLHRRIDEFTDSHPLFKKSKRVFYDNFEKYSGVLVDIYFDHLLAKNFEVYSKLSLSEFSNNVYEVYEANRELLPGSSNKFLDYVVQNNIYKAYATQAGITTVLFHLSHRIKHGVQLDQSINNFIENEQQLNEDFHVFFQEALLKFV